MAPWFSAFVGGALLGAASALLFVALGRIAGISGIVGTLLDRGASEPGWRVAFVGGLLVAGITAMLFAPGAIGTPVRSLPIVAIAGLLVGFGTRLGSGCTSGHGVCGLGRFSTRSLVAVLVFMTSGAITATIAGASS